jgi:outer membrane immunogenic protein
MKKLLLGSVVALSVSVPAIAADMAVRPIARPIPLTTWTGCYLGGTVGAGWGRSEGYSSNAATTSGAATHFTSILAGVPLTDSFNMSGLIGGAYGGCQIQLGFWVIGAEGDFEAINKEGQAFYPGNPAKSPIPLAAGGVGTVGPGVYFSAKERWLATARGRIGYAFDKWLFTVSGGAAWAKIDSAESTTGGAAFVVGSISPPATPVFLTDLQSDRRLGWTVGAAAEYALPYNWSIRAEYLYVQIPSYTTFTPGTTNELFKNVTAGRLTDNIVRFGLAYKFWPWGAVVR